ncbi:methyltransferase domain-containing protein [Actinophytocola sp.]|uniref:methyltransferase domain-containing protein n=1 Tax=Actinophytocola sp. TaxID=1872138 RepID=UPI002D7E8AB9|nr:methyltransferase domain-containing protein [Actinophytocola sp.]HET9144327.1 methyltransferase domain-containing protein [Actinophytocola sp.]
MSDAHLADALARLDAHKNLNLPLRRGDLLGRLAVRFLWRRVLKWQVETNLATRDAISSVRDITAGQRVKLDPLAANLGDGAGLVTAEQLHRELNTLRQSDQNLMAGLNQRIYSAIGGLRTELGDLRLRLAEKQEETDDVAQRLAALDRQLAALVAGTRDLRTRHAHLDLLIDKLRAEPDRAVQATVAALPNRDAFLELAIAELLDGPLEPARARRMRYLPLVEQAVGDRRTGDVFDMSPGRGEWLEALRTAGVPVRSASENPYVVRHCATLGFDLTERDPLDVLADADHRTLAAITAHRFVERLEVSSVTRFVELAAATLRPGGVLVVETPHPGGAAAADFHLDPFARQPVHPELLRFLADSAGFAGTEIRYLDDGPLADWRTGAVDPATVRADRYCLIAWR